MPQLRVALFGRCDVTLDGERVGPPLSPHAQALFTYLAFYRDTSFPRRVLSAFLWPDETEQAAADNLQAIVTEIQHLLNQRLYDAPPFLLANRESVTLNPASSIIVDTATFENHLYAVDQHQHRRLEACPQCIQRLVRAAALYTGSFLAGIRVDCPSFEEWVSGYRAQFKARILKIFTSLLTHYQLVEDFEQLAFYARRCIAVDPWNETGHVILLQAIKVTGEPGAVKTHFEDLRQQYTATFHKDLPLAVVDAYKALQIPQGDIGFSSSECSPSVQERVSLYALPKCNMPVIGREAELLQLSDWLSEDAAQCIVLIGPGGVGKTHLALAAAEATRGAFDDGVVYFTLTEPDFTHDDTFLTLESEYTQPTGEMALRYSENERSLLRNLCDTLNLALNPLPIGEISEDRKWFESLHDREMLLIIDNAERSHAKIKHMLDNLAAAAPSITFILCTRNIIMIEGARILQVAPLPVPQQSDSALAADYASVRLFTAYACQQDPEFTLNEDVLPSVIDICQQVEGLPLSLVLAATWIPDFTVTQIADAVTRDLSVLIATSSSIPERHQSLQAVFEGSWRTLTTSEQSLLGQAVVFKDGFDEQAASDIFAVDSHIPQTLRALVNNGFLIQDSEKRYHLSKIAHQYVTTRSVLGDEHTDGDELALRHASYYLDPDKWMNGDIVFDFDSQNIRQAWQWTVAKGDLAVFKPGLMGWIEYLEKRGRFQEGSAACEILIWRLKYRDDLDATLPEIQDMIGRLYAARGSFLTMQGKYTEASEVIQYALSLAVNAKNASLEAEVRLTWGTLLWRQGDYAAAQTHISQALQQAQELAEGDISQRCLYYLGMVTMHQSDYSVAQMYLQQSLDLSKLSTDGYNQGKVLNELGFLAQSLGDYVIARSYLQEALELFNKAGSLWGKGTTQQNLGFVAHRLGDYDEARKWYEQALFTNRECANHYAEAKTLSSLGLLFCHLGDFEAAHNACQQAYGFARQLGDRAAEVEVLIIWGHAYAGQHEIIEAAAAYQKALDLCQELGHRDEAAEAISGLVNLALIEGAGIHAMPFVERILDRIRHTEELKGAIEPLRVYLICYKALVDNRDTRATQILERAYQLLMTQAEKLENLTERNIFLSNVAVHREIVNLYERD